MEKPRIILEPKPAKIIRWFTENWDKEIGAMGVGRVENGGIVVEKLAFPNQVVNGAHVHFTPEGWTPIIKELTEEELGKIVFYWHKHPDNCPSASPTDEEDTFEAFMAPEAKRKIFGFLQTSLKDKTSGSIVYEARIAIAKPIRINTTDIDLIFMDDDKIRKECEKIIKDKVTEGNKNSTDQPGVTGNTTLPNLEKSVVVAEPDRTLKGNLDSKLNLNKRFDVKKLNGMVVIIYSPMYVVLVDEKLAEAETLLNCRSYRHKKLEKDGYYITALQPFKKKLDALYTMFINFALEVNSYMDNESKVTGLTGLEGIQDYYIR